MGGAIVPPFGDMPTDTATLAFTHALHRYVGVVVGVVLAGTWFATWRARRAGRADRSLFALVTIAAALYPLQALVGALQVWTQLAPWTQTLHVALAAFVWVAAIGATFVSYYGARAAARRAAPGPAARGACRDGLGDARSGRSIAGRHRPRLRRPDEAPDHRAAPHHDGARDGARDPRPPRHGRLDRLGLARRLDPASAAPSRPAAPTPSTSTSTATSTSS